MLKHLFVTMTLIATSFSNAAACDFTVVHNLSGRILGASAYSANSQSMFPTLPAGQIFWASPVDIAKIKRGDIITFCTKDQPATQNVKRVIGLGGDHVRLVQNQVMLNGTELRRVYMADREFLDIGSIKKKVTCFIETLINHNYEVCQLIENSHSLNTTPEFVVPSNALFVLGDNRDVSNDSRYPMGVSYVQLENVTGVVIAP